MRNELPHCGTERSRLGGFRLIDLIADIGFTDIICGFGIMVMIHPEHLTGFGDRIHIPSVLAI